MSSSLHFTTSLFSMKIPVVDLVGSVVFVFTHDSPLYPDDLNSDHLEAVKQRIIASLEQKFAESLAGKKGKDKAAVDPKLDVSAITESFCSTIPVEILSEAIAFRSQVDTECRKKGYVIDCWEKDVFPSGDISTYQNFNKDRNSIPCQITFQLQVEYFSVEILPILFFYIRQKSKKFWTSNWKLLEHKLPNQKMAKR